MTRFSDSEPRASRKGGARAHFSPTAGGAAGALYPLASPVRTGVPVPGKNARSAFVCCFASPRFKPRETGISVLPFFVTYVLSFWTTSLRAPPGASFLWSSRPGSPTHVARTRMSTFHEPWLWLRTVRASVSSRIGSSFFVPLDSLLAGPGKRS